MRAMRKIRSENSMAIKPEKLQSVSKISFHESIKFLLVTAQFFGVMPLHDITKDVSQIYFKWKSIRVIYTLINALGSFVELVCWLIKFCRDGFSVDQSAPVCFYFCTSVASLILIKVAKNWSVLVKEWAYVEMTMRSYRSPINLKKKFICITSTFLVIGFFEHILFILNGLSSAQNCKGFTENPLKFFFVTSFQNVFSVIQYSHWLGVIVKFLNSTATFTWTFTDLLIILISIGLTARFRQIALRMKHNRVYTEKFLVEIRQDYQRLYSLYKKVGEQFSSLVLISYIQNILFLCIQLYNSLRERTGIVEPIYFFYSFGFLVLRILAVSLYAAWLYEEAQKPIEYLHVVPPEHYCPEVTRLMGQIYINPVAITGSGFFLVTKNFLVQIAGTVVTFELMIFQFAPVSQRKFSGYNCTI